jgi:hypothetical protein
MPSINREAKAEPENAKSEITRLKFAFLTSRTTGKWKRWADFRPGDGVVPRPSVPGAPVYGPRRAFANLQTELRSWIARGNQKLLLWSGLS